MLTIFADTLLLATGQSPLPRPAKERPFDAAAEHARRRFWLNIAILNR